MLEKVHIYNFQRHKFLEVIFGEDITSIIGLNDAGKSAIMRALRWLCLNIPPKKNMIRFGAKFARVILWVGGHKIVRQQGKSGNFYKVDGKVLRFDHTLKRNTVPKEVQDILKIGPDNFQRQHDEFFWLSQSPGQISKELNKIVNLQAIDTSLAYINSKHRRVKTELEVSQDRLDNARGEYNNLKWVYACKERLDHIGELGARVRKKGILLSKLTILIKELDRLERKERMLNKALRKLPDLSRLTSLAEQIKTHEEDLELLDRHLEGIEDGERKLCAIEESIASAKSSLEKMGTLCPTCGRPMTS